MIYKLGILGVSGRMGLEIAGLLAAGYTQGSDMLELADAVASSSKLGSVEGVPVRQLGAPAFEPVHAWIDFSRPSASVTLLTQIDTPLVIGTTGFDEAQLAKVRAYAEKHPVVLAPNTSPGMNLITEFIAALPPNEGLDFDVVLQEEHHRHKKDAPSGTAKLMIAALEKAGYPPGTTLVVRAGGLRGTHAVKLISEDEEITIEHRVHDRKVFARGALRAVHFLLKKKTPGLYTMADVFKA